MASTRRVGTILTAILAAALLFTFLAVDVTAATDEFVAMLEGIGDSFDNGDLEGMKNTPKTFVDGLATYLGAIKDAVKP